MKSNFIKQAKKNVFGIIVHGCNCHCCMDDGISKQIKKEYSVAHYTDLDFPQKGKNRLGWISVAGAMQGEKILYIVNAYIQCKDEQGRVCIDYMALRKCFRKVKLIADNRKIGYPKIGEGAIGADWDIIKKIIDQELEGEDHTFVEN